MILNSTIDPGKIVLTEDYYANDEKKYVDNKHVGRLRQNGKHICKNYGNTADAARRKAVWGFEEINAQCHKQYSEIHKSKGFKIWKYFFHFNLRQNSNYLK